MPKNKNKKNRLPNVGTSRIQTDTTQEALQEAKIVKRDILQTTLVNTLFIVALIALYYVNKTGNELDHLISTILK
jgi:hypothetical protein